MPDVIVLYWQPGSGGDLVHHLLLSCPEQYQGIVTHFYLDQNGRVTPQISKEFKDTFMKDSYGSYIRLWSVNDCESLYGIIKDIKSKYFIIPTHHLSQVNFLKSQFNNCKTLGVTYPSNMFPIVLKNWCKKVAINDLSLKKIYNNKKHQYLESKDVFGEFILSEQLKHTTTIQQSVKNTFDFSVSLENLYNNNLSDLMPLLNSNQYINDLFQKWLINQDILPKNRYNIIPLLEHALGYNSKIIHPQDPLNTPLDTFDNMLIKHNFKSSIKNIPTFTTLNQANQFLSKIAG